MASQLHGDDFRNAGLAHVGVERVPQLVECKVYYSRALGAVVQVIVGREK